MEEVTLVTKPIRAAGALGCASLLAAATLAGCSGGSPSPTTGTHSSSASPSASGTPVSTAASPVSSSTGSAIAAPSASMSPASTSIPAAAWIQSSAIPLDAKYRWTAPAAVAKTAKSPILSVVQDCRLKLSSADQSELGAFPAAQADLAPTNGASGRQDDWAAQETILATGDTSSGDIQGIYSLYTDLVADLAKCANTASGAKVSVAASQGPEYAATITVPTSTGSTLTWHEYLAAPYGYLVELSVYVAPYAGDKPSAVWDGSSASTVLGALRSGPCSVTKLC